MSVAFDPYRFVGDEVRIQTCSAHTVKLLIKEMNVAFKRGKVFREALMNHYTNQSFRSFNY